MALSKTWGKKNPVVVLGGGGVNKINSRENMPQQGMGRDGGWGHINSPKKRSLKESRGFFGGFPTRGREKRGKPKKHPQRVAVGEGGGNGNKTKRGPPKQKNCKT